MKSFNGKLAVVSGGGSGMGASLVTILASEGCSVAFCEVVQENIAKTIKRAEAVATNGAKVTGHYCDVAKEEDWQKFRDEALKVHNAQVVHLLFNNAGVGSGGSFLAGDREAWERVFNICWFGVYYGCRTFMPLLVAAPESHVVNTSSVNGFWATIGPNAPHTSYSASKFAVKGFTEALINDCKIHAPHVGVSVVMPGYIGTGIVGNSGKIVGSNNGAINSEETNKAFEANAPTTADQAARVILDGVRNNKWRILIGDDARIIDEAVRADPENAYERSFYRKVMSAGALATAPKLRM